MSLPYWPQMLQLYPLEDDLTEYPRASSSNDCPPGTQESSQYQLTTDREDALLIAIQALT